MLEDFKAMYRILSYLHKRIDTPYATYQDILKLNLQISENRLQKLLREMQTNGYISGLVWAKNMSSAMPMLCDGCIVEITLKGMEYLEENSIMRKAKEAICGIAGVALSKL